MIGEMRDSQSFMAALTAADTGHDQLVVVDLHEVRSINAGLRELEAMGFGTESLLPQDRTGSEDPRYTLRRGDSEIGLEDLRSLLSFLNIGTAGFVLAALGLRFTSD